MEAEARERASVDMINNSATTGHSTMSSSESERESIATLGYLKNEWALLKMHAPTSVEMSPFIE